MSDRPKQKKGFALKENRKHINKAGRPKGSRNRNKLAAAQRKIDDATPDAVNFYHAILMGDKDTLRDKYGFTDTQIESISSKLRFDAAKEIVKGGSEEMKAIAGDKGDNITDTPEEEVEELATGTDTVVPFTFKRDEIED